MNDDRRNIGPKINRSLRPGISFGARRPTHDEHKKYEEMLLSRANNIASIEPLAQNELKEISYETAHHQPTSKHQLFLNSLRASGLHPDDIEKAWHEYYQNLSDAEKIEVWREYEETAKKAQLEPEPARPLETTTTTETPNASYAVFAENKKPVRQPRVPFIAAILENHHIRSIAYAVAAGAFFVGIMNNEIIFGKVKAYISPGTVVANQVITDVSDVKVGQKKRS